MDCSVFFWSNTKSRFKYMAEIVLITNTYHGTDFVCGKCCIYQQLFCIFQADMNNIFVRRVVKMGIILASVKIL